LGERVDAVILAGGEPGKADPLVEYAQVQKKALIQIAGKEMARYVVEAIAGSSRVGRIFIVGLSPEDGVEFATPVEYVEAAGSMLDNIVAGMERVTEVDPDVERVIVSSADIPLVTTEMVDYLSLGATSIWPKSLPSRPTSPWLAKHWRPVRISGSKSGCWVLGRSSSLLSEGSPSPTLNEWPAGL